MKALFSFFVFSFCIFCANYSFSQNYYLKSSIMQMGRCGSNFSGAPRQIATQISIDEGENLIRIIYSDGTSGYNLKIQSSRPSDDAFGIITYKLFPDGQGFHTVIYDRDPVRNFIILVRADNTCMMYALD
jgi:hypothetical protein